jgi:hypothetical protein
MALTNAEKQARWRNRRKAEIERLRAEVDALIKRPTQGEQTPRVRLTPPPHRRGQMMMTNDTTVDTYKAIRAAITKTLGRFLEDGEEADSIAVAALDAILYMCTLQGVEVDTLKRMRSAIDDELNLSDDGDEE